MLTKVEQVYLDLIDLIDSGQIDDFQISVFPEFSTLREFLVEQKEKLARVVYDGE